MFCKAGSSTITCCSNRQAHETEISIGGAYFDFFPSLVHEYVYSQRQSILDRKLARGRKENRIRVLNNMSDVIFK